MSLRDQTHIKVASGAHDTLYITKPRFTAEIDVDERGLDTSDTPYFTRDRLALRLTDELGTTVIVAALDRHAERKLREALMERDR